MSAVATKRHTLAFKASGKESVTRMLCLQAGIISMSVMSSELHRACC